MFYFPPGWWFQPIWTKILWNHPATQPPSLRNPSNRRSWTWWTWWRLGWRSFTRWKIHSPYHPWDWYIYLLHSPIRNQPNVCRYIYQSHGCGMGFATFSEVDRVEVARIFWNHVRTSSAPDLLKMFFFMFCSTLKRRSDISTFKSLSRLRGRRSCWWQCRWWLPEDFLQHSLQRTFFFSACRFIVEFSLVRVLKYTASASFR